VEQLDGFIEFSSTVQRTYSASLSTIIVLLWINSRSVVGLHRSWLLGVLIPCYLGHNVVIKVDI
jgi:hypothetical protein